MNAPSPQAAAHFENLYQHDVDPWKFSTSAYELARYETTLKALSRSSYRRVFEPGCAEGVLTAALAQRADSLVACDLSETAVRRARERCCAFEHVQIDRRDVAEGAPEGTYDLIMFSELGYYFSATRLRAVIQLLASSVRPGGEIVAVHWLGQSKDHVLHGDEVHEVLAQSLPWTPLVSSRHVGFRLDSWRRAA